MAQTDSRSRVSGIVLAGGQSSRLGEDKAFVTAGGQPLIERVVQRLQSVVDEVVVVTQFPERFAFLGVEVTSDRFANVGALSGLHAGLSTIRRDYGLVVGCDMPFLSTDLLHFMVSLIPGHDVVIPHIGSYYEPLHAIYAKACVASIEQQIRAGQRRLYRVCDGMRVRYVNEQEIATHDPQLLSFFNVNSPDDLNRMRTLLGDAEPH